MINLGFKPSLRRYSRKWVNTAKLKIWLLLITWAITLWGMSMSNMLTKIILKMLWTTSMEGSLEGRRYLLFFRLWLISSMLNASSILTVVAKEEGIAIICMSNRYRKASKSNCSRRCTLSILSTASKRNKRVMMSSKRERRKREDKGKTRRRERARTIQDLSLSIRRRIIRSTGTDLGRDLQPVTVLRREEISLQNGMQTSSTSDGVWKYSNHFLSSSYQKLS